MPSYMKGLASVSVTATPQRVYFPDATMAHTVRNTGSNAAYYLYNPAVLTAAFAGASAAIVRALGGSALPAGVAVVVPPGVAWLDLVCITGETATVVVDAGEQFQLSPV
jgi:hypothetical protein